MLRLQTPRRANLQLWVRAGHVQREGRWSCIVRTGVHSQPTWQGWWWLTRFSFLKLYPALWPPPPDLGNHPEAVATGTPAVTTTSHCMKQESWSSQKWDEVWPLLQSGCCPFSSPDFLVAVLNLSSVEHSRHKEASLHSGLPGWRGFKVRKSRWVSRSRVRHHQRSWHLEGSRGQVPSPPLTFHPLSLRAPSPPWSSYFSTHSLPPARFKLTGSLLPATFRESIQTNSLFILPPPPGLEKPSRACYLTLLSW